MMNKEYISDDEQLISDILKEQGLSPLLLNLIEVLKNDKEDYIKDVIIDLKNTLENYENRYSK